MSVISSGVFSQTKYTLSGTILGEQNLPLAYASISIDQATYGTISDAEGNFRIDLPSGVHEVRISYLGYRPEEFEIDLQGPLRRNFTLVPEQVTLEDVIITSDGRDPAYAIMKAAIDRKKENANPFEAYQYRAYTKSAFKFKEGYDPDSLAGLNPFGGRGSDEEEEDIPPELQSELLFLSENVSEVFIRAPNKVKENILSSRVSGDSEQFSILGNLFNRFDPYKNRTVMGQMAERGIVSPMSNNAFFFYDFKLMGTTQHAEGKAYKIQIIPKREYDPVYTGTIYIADSTYAVKEIDWQVTRQQQIQFIDTLTIRQTYQWISDAWLPIQTRIGFAVEFNIFGTKIPVEGFLQSILSEYEIEPDFDKKLFNREIIAIADSALKQDTSFWSEIRPIALSDEETRDYTFMDSLETVQNSPEYLDSLTEANSELKPFDILINGYTYRNYRKKTEWRLEALLATWGYNPMEGFYVAPALTREWEFENDRSLSISGRIRYGFSDQQINGTLSLAWLTNTRRNELWKLSGGRYPSQFSGYEQISPNLNRLYAVLTHESFIRLYRSNFGSLSYQRELFNGLRFSASTRYESRRNMENTSDYSIFNRDDMYEPNISIPSHDAWIGEVQFRYQPFNRYISVPNDKINIGSRWPALSLTYTQTFDTGDEQTSDFSKIVFSLDQELRLGLLGNSQYRVSIGRFLTDDVLFFPDFFHFKGNETIIRDGNYDEFWLMPYYAASTQNEFLEAHYEHSFGGFIFNKLPFIRKLKLKEYAGVHLLAREGGRPYAELNIGLEKLLFKVFPFRIDFNLVLTDTDLGADRWGGKWVLPSTN